MHKNAVCPHGSGNYGKDGLPIPTTLYIKMYGVPWATYGVECLQLSKEHITMLELFQCLMIHSLLNLPDRTAIAGLYIPTNILPMEALIHKKVLCLLHALLKSEGPSRDIILWQYILMHRKSKSWVIYVKDILTQYSLPCIFRLHQLLLSKHEWMIQVKRAIHAKITKDIKEEAVSKSSITFLNPSFKPKVCHQSVSLCKSPRDVRRASIKAHLLTGNYTLQELQLTFGKAILDIYQVCNAAKEDMIHFLVECPYLYVSRIT